jgi:hypothetical protein
MKILATIESVEITRKVQHQDGTWGNVYGITLASGDDRILAERFTSDEGLKKAGIVAGAVGNAQLEFNVNRGTSKAGNPYCIQNIRLVRFDLANRNISTESAQTAAGGATEQSKEEKPAEGTQVPAEPEPQPEEGKTSDLPF